MRPDCHHHLKARRSTSNAIFDGLAVYRKVSDESLGSDETYVCEASHEFVFIFYYK